MRLLGMDPLVVEAPPSQTRRVLLPELHLHTIRCLGRSAGILRMVTRMVVVVVLVLARLLGSSRRCFSQLAV